MEAQVCNCDQLLLDGYICRRPRLMTISGRARPAAKPIVGHEKPTSTDVKLLVVCKGFHSKQSC